MNVLALFAKHWQPGRVKTRLAAKWGPQRASEVYLAFVRCLLARLAAAGDERWLAYTPPESQAEFCQLADPSWQLVEQANGDLGQRMAALFDQAFASGASRVVLIGSDSPTLPAAHIEQAFDSLLYVPVVLGPAHDGGYCLIGASGKVPPIFTGIDWSTDQVLQQTLARLQAAEVAYTCLPPWPDIDTPEDLQRLRAQLAEATHGHELSLRQALEHALHHDP
jgi:rSAM/selenodomain-associated transferase 1